MKTIISIIPVLLVVFMTGCAHTSPTVSAPQTGAGLPSEARASVDQQVVERGLTFRVNATGPVDATSLTNQVRTQAAASLNQRGYRVGEDQADLLVNLDVSQEHMDDFGNFSVLKGTVNASVLRSIDSKVVAAETVDALGDRSLTQSDASSSLARNLAAATGKWLAESANPQAIGLAANDITVRIPRQWGVFQRRADTYTNLFIREVGRLDGVSSVILTDFSEDQRSLTFRVVYLPDFFPQGILFAITRISDLNLRP